MITIKSHAKDYLNEFKESQPLWMQKLIQQAINTNGNILEDDLKQIYKILKTDRTSKQVTSKPLSVDTADKLVIKKLTHNCGVNALANSQSITFNENCNVLFGLNGSGKSSYFRVLNEISGGNEKKDILPNIYFNDQSDISVDIDYLIGSKTDKLNWINTSREISPFNTIRVFDSSYLNGLLSKREIDSTLIEPFGLNLFSYIIDIVDSYKKQLNNDISFLKFSKPTINVDNFIYQNKGLFYKNYLTDSEQKEVEHKFAFSNKNSKDLEELTKKYNDLNQLNIQDKIKVKTVKYNEIEAIKYNVEKSEKSLNTILKKSQELLKEYESIELSSNQYKKQIEVLRTLPSSDSEIWKSFIKSASNYSMEVKDSDKNCVYCRQPLDSGALDIVRAYGKYLNNESEIALERIKNEIINLINDLEKINLISEIKPEIKSFFEQINIDESTTLLNGLDSFIKKFNSVKNTLRVSLDEKSYSVKLNPISSQNLFAKIDDTLVMIKTDIDQFRLDDSVKQKNLNDLHKQIKLLEEHKSIFEQKDKIKDWICIGQNIKEIETKANPIKTRALSDLSKEAHSQLLTENLKTKFEEELKIIGFNSHEVKLEEAGVSKGKSQTKLKLKAIDKISSVLSEGEQKAVALSIFIAEIRMQSQSNPIIFDDPVNSLDHKFASKFAHRILKLDNQTIVFTHNKLFLDAFETAKNHHVCKNYDGGCSTNSTPHIYLYSVQTEGKSSKGIVLPKKNDKAKTHLDDVNKYLSESPFSKYSECAIKLRKAVECIVDEVIFNEQVPTKLSSKNNRIYWDNLKQLNNDKTIIDTLKSVHDRVSGREIHNGTESDENPIDKEEFLSMAKELEFLMGCGKK